MRPMKFDYLPSSPPDPIDVAHLELENDALRARVAELEALLGRICAAIKEEQGGVYLACELLGSILYTEIMQHKS